MTTPTTKRRSLLTLAGATAGLAAFIVPSAAADPAAEGPAAQPDLGSEPFTIQGTCGQHFDPVVTNNGAIAARAHWDVICGNGGVRMVGWVDDTLSDGKCAYINATFADHNAQAKNCPADSPRTTFDWKGPGNSVNGYLSVS